MSPIPEKLHWLDYLILAVLAVFFGYIWYQIEGTLNYNWRWDLIPNYILRYHTSARNGSPTCCCRA